MARIISFAWTTPALVAGHKTVTRRDWDDDYARTFQPGQIVHAYDRSPRHRGNHVATLRIVSVTKEANSETPDSDYEAEGMAYLAKHPDALPKAKRIDYLEQVSWGGFVWWRLCEGESWVIRFEVVSIKEQVAA